MGTQEVPAGSVPSPGAASGAGGKAKKLSGQEPKIGQRDVRQHPYVGKVSGDLHYLPSGGDLKFPAKMPLLGACLDLRHYCLEAEGAQPHLAGGCWLPCVSQVVLESHDPLRHRITHGENQSYLSALWNGQRSCETLIQAVL